MAAIFAGDSVSLERPLSVLEPDIDISFTTRRIIHKICKSQRLRDLRLT